MRRQFLAVAGVCVVALTVAVGLAWAAKAMSVNIPFSFIVKDKEMPAGQYIFEPLGGDMSQMIVKSSGGTTVVAPVIERLADTGSKQPAVVFDKAGGKHYLSEVHIPGMDGFLVGITKGEEAHEVVKGKE